MLNNEDKKYIKENIERRLDKIEDRLDGSDKDVYKQSVKVLSEQEKAQKFREEISKKFNSLYKDQKTPDEKKDYKRNLQKLDDMGIATLAEKVELLKLQIKDSVPKEFTDAVKQSGKLAKQGANQALKGASNLVGKAMNLNPLTAMIWAQRGLVGDVANIGIGGVKAVAGGVGALAGGVGKLTSAALAMLPKPKIKQTNDEETPTNETTNEETGLFASNAKKVEEIEETEDGGAKQLSDLHKLFVKGDYLKKRDERDKEGQNIMSKGLSVMAKGLNGINGAISLILNKQKLIAGTLLIGAVGILALVGWFKNGGFSKLLNDLLGGGEDNGGTDAGMKYLNTQSAAVLDNDKTVDSLINPNAHKDVGFIDEDIHEFGRYHKGDKFREYAKNLGVSNAVLNSTDASEHTVMQSKNVQTTVLTLPFKTYIVDVIDTTNEDGYLALRICRAKKSTNTGGNASAMYEQISGKDTWLESGITLTYTKVLQQLQPTHRLINEYTPIAILDAKYQALGSKDFFNDKETGTELTNYAFKTNSQLENLGKNYKNSRTKAIQDEHKKQALSRANKIQNDIDLKDATLGAKVKESIKDWALGDNISENDFKKQAGAPVEDVKQEEVSTSAPTENTNKPNTAYKEMSPNAKVRPLPTLNVNQENLSTKTNDEAKQVKATGTHTIAPETGEGSTTKQQKSQINIKAPNKSRGKGIPGEYLSTSQYYAATVAK